MHFIFYQNILCDWFIKGIVALWYNMYLFSLLILLGINLFWAAYYTQTASSSIMLKGTGLPVPRFISLRSDIVNLRAGPGVQYPLEWTYTTCRSYPMEIIAEFDAWRRIRDWEGSEGWVHYSMLDKKRTFIILGQRRNLLTYPSEDAPLIARLEPGIVGNLLQCPVSTALYCQIEVNHYIGWLKRSDFWGVLQSEFVQ